MAKTRQLSFPAKDLNWMPRAKKLYHSFLLNQLETDEKIFEFLVLVIEKDIKLYEGCNLPPDPLAPGDAPIRLKTTEDDDELLIESVSLYHLLQDIYEQNPQFFLNYTNKDKKTLTTIANNIIFGQEKRAPYNIIIILINQLRLHNLYKKEMRVTGLFHIDHTARWTQSLEKLMAIAKSNDSSDVMKELRSEAIRLMSFQTDLLNGLEYGKKEEIHFFARKFFCEYTDLIDKLNEFEFKKPKNLNLPLVATPELNHIPVTPATAPAIATPAVTPNQKDIDVTPAAPISIIKTQKDPVPTADTSTEKNGDEYHIPFAMKLLFFTVVLSIVALAVALSLVLSGGIATLALGTLPLIKPAAVLLAKIGYWAIPSIFSAIFTLGSAIAGISYGIYCLVTHKKSAHVDEKKSQKSTTATLPFKPEIPVNCDAGQQPIPQPNNSDVAAAMAPTATATKDSDAPRPKQ